MPLFRTEKPENASLSMRLIEGIEPLILSPFFALGRENVLLSPIGLLFQLNSTFLM